MVRALLAGVAVASLAAAAGAAPQQVQPDATVFTQKTGEASRSVDGKWRISSRAPTMPDAESSDSRSMASLWLEGPGTPAKRLTVYRREGVLFWLGDGRHALFVHQDTHLQDARLFTLSGAGSPQKQVEAAIEKSMAASPPRLGSVENRLISAERAPGGALCLSVEESGLPPGRTEGSFVSKNGVFLVAPNGTTTRIAACPA